jgi:hypothetical protein
LCGFLVRFPRYLCGGEQAVDEAEDASQPPAAVADGDEDRVVEQGEDQAVDEVCAVAEGFGAGLSTSPPASAAQMLIVWPARSRRRR